MILILVDQSGPDQSGPGDQGTGGPETVMAEIVEKRGPEWTRGPGDQGTGNG